MPPSLKRQKLDNATDIPWAPAQRGIRAFTKISKPHGETRSGGKSKLDGRRSADQKLGTPSVTDVNHLKRKRGSSQERSGEEGLGRDCFTPPPEEPHQDQQHIAAGTTAISLTCIPLSPKRPHTIRPKARTSPSIYHTPSKVAASRLESLALLPSSPSDLNVISLSSLETSGTPPPSPLPIKVRSLPPRDTHDGPVGLPDELHDLVDLHSSFLTALSLHYAHNGSPTPVDLRILRPGVERAWRKRRVSTDDVRRILGIEQDVAVNCDHGEPPPRASTLSLSDYGNGKICIEMDAHSEPRGFRRRPLDEEALNTRFAHNLMRLWDAYRQTTGSSSTAAAFISQLPLAPVTLCASVSKISPLLAKGQRRLEDLKAGAIRAQRNSAKPGTSCSPSDSSLTPKPAPTRNDSLLSRIRAKQLHQSTLAPPPDQASLLRKSALQRLPEIIPVLEILAAAASARSSRPPRAPDSSAQQPTSDSDQTPPSSQGGTCSFTMPTLVQHLQMSLQHPIAKDDAIRCIRLLAAEVAPGWIGVREVGRVVGVTVRRGRQLGREEVGRRIAELVGE